MGAGCARDGGRVERDDWLGGSDRTGCAEKIEGMAGCTRAECIPELRVEVVLCAERVFEASMLGQLIRGKYRVTRLLDEGGMSKIYLARQAEPAREVVVKVLKESLHAQSKTV